VYGVWIPQCGADNFFLSIFSLSSLIFVYEPLNFKNNPLVFFLDLDYVLLIVICFIWNDL
jgi:hypothetical protein